MKPTFRSYLILSALCLGSFILANLRADPPVTTNQPVWTTGNQSISGTKNFTGTIQLSGVSLAASATTDATNAANITSGTLSVSHGGTGQSSIPAFLVNATGSSQSLPNSASAVLEWPTIVEDTSGGFAANVYTCPRTGWMILTTCVTFSGSGAYFNLVIYQNGASGFDIYTNGTSSGISGSAVIPVSAGDTLELQVYQISGGALGLGTASSETWWSGCYVR
jgi:hypothetical protein